MSFRRDDAAGRGEQHLQHRKPPLVKLDARQKADLLLQQRSSQQMLQEEMYQLLKKEKDTGPVQAEADVSVPLHILQLEQQKCEQYRQKAEALAESVATLEDDKARLHAVVREDQRVILSLRKSESSLQFSATKASQRALELESFYKAEDTYASKSDMHDEIAGLKRDCAAALAAKARLQNSLAVLQKERDELLEASNVLKFQVRDQTKRVSDSSLNTAKLDEVIRRKDVLKQTHLLTIRNLTLKLRRVVEMCPRRDALIRASERRRAADLYEHSLMSTEDNLQQCVALSGLKELKEENTRLHQHIKDIEQKNSSLENQVAAFVQDAVRAEAEQRQSAERIELIQTNYRDREVDYEGKLATLRQNLRNSEDTQGALEKSLHEAQRDLCSAVERTEQLRSEHLKAEQRRAKNNEASLLAPMCVEELQDLLEESEARVKSLRAKNKWVPQLHHRLLTLGGVLSGRRPTYPASVHDIKATLELDCFALDILIHCVKFPDSPGLPLPADVMTVMQALRGTEDEETKLADLIKQSPSGVCSGLPHEGETQAHLVTDIPVTTYHCKSSIPASHIPAQCLRFGPVSEADELLDESAGHPGVQRNAYALRLSRSRGKRFMVQRESKKRLTISIDRTVLPGVQMEWKAQKKGRVDWGYLPAPPHADPAPSRFPKLFDCMKEMRDFQ